MPGPRQGFSPQEIAKALREEYPKKFDEFDDAEVIATFQEIDPDTYKGLVDPLLIGQEIADAPDVKGRTLRMGAFQPAPAPRKHAPPMLPPTFADTVATTGLRIVPAIGGAVAGSFIAPGPGSYVGGAAGAAAGEAAAQAYEKTFLDRQAYSPGTMAFEGALGAVMPAARGATALRRIGQQATVGAGLGGAGTVGRSVIEHGELPSLGEVATGTALGAAFGGATHGAMEGFQAVGRAVPQMGDATGQLPGAGGTAHPLAAGSPDAQGVVPTRPMEMVQPEGPATTVGVPPPPLFQPAGPGGFPAAALPPPSRPITKPSWYPGDDLAWQTEVETFRGQPGVVHDPAFQQAIAQQYDLEEQRLAAALAAVYGPNARPANGVDYHTALESKAYLEQIAALKRSREELTRELAALQPLDPARLLPATAGPDAPPTLSYPPEAVIEPIGTGVRAIGGAPPGAVPATPQSRQFQGVLEESLQAPPGPPRLVRPLVLSSERPAAQVGGAPPLLDQTLRPAGGALEQTGRVGGRPATPQQPRLKGVLQGQETARTYPEGPNAGPRRPPRQEPHQAPRTLPTPTRGGKARPSTLPAEDPGTYPPEVRRELARMLAEMQDFQYERYQGGTTAGQLRAMVDEGIARDTSEAVELLRRSGVSGGGASPGAPVYDDILEAAEGYRHATRATVTKTLREALLEGKGHHLADVAAQVARRRLEWEGLDMDARLARADRPPRKPAHRPGAGDALIGWVDEAGNRALPDQDLDEVTRAVRDMEDGEVTAAHRLLTDMGGLDAVTPESREWFEKALEEGARRGLITRQQLDLTMEGPGGAGGPKLFDFSPEEADAFATKRRASDIGAPPPPLEDFGLGPTIRRQAAEATANQGVTLRGTPKDVAHSPEAQRLEAERRAIEAAELPGLEGVRAESRALPPVAEAPFALSPPPAKPVKKLSLKQALANEMKRLFSEEEGALYVGPPPPMGDKKGLRAWLTQQEKDHGGEPWFSRVEQHLEDGNLEGAWKAAASASARSYARAYAQATPEQEQLLQRAVRGTALQDDLSSQIVAGARARAGVGEAPPVKDFPPSKRVTQAGAARGRATIGPAGVLNPGSRKRPLSSAAPELRAATLDRAVVQAIMETTAPEGMATIPGNTDTYLRLFRQVGEVVYKGENLKLLREAGVSIPPEELAQHFNATVSDAGRTLNLLSQFARTHAEALTEAAGRQDIGGMLGRGGPPRYAGKGRAVGAPGQKATQEVIDQVAKETSSYQAAALANDLQKRAPVGPLRALHDASYSFMLSKWNTGVRNYMSFTGRYAMDSLDHALTIPLAKLTGEADTAALSTALLKERGVTPFRTGAAVTPKAAWSDQLGEIYKFTEDSLAALKPQDVRRSIRLLLDLPEQAAHYLGTMGGEDLSQEFVNTPVLRHLTNPKVQRMLTMFNRAQEFSARATVFDATTRALLRAKGLDPSTLLQKSTPEIVSAVGGQQAFDDLLFTATATSLEATFAGRTSKDSIPGALIRFVNDAWPLKLGMPFPRFNLSAAPRWIYDHSPAALLDWVRFPLDRAGITAPKGTAAGGRLYRGVRAQEIQQTDLPALQLRIGQAEKAQGTALQELLSTQREFQIRGRQIMRLEKRAQQGLPGVDSQLTLAREAQQQLGRRRDRLKMEMQDSRSVVGDLKAEQKKLLDRVVDATGINAPNFAQSLARMSVGTVGMLGAAWVVRSQEGAKGTRWYEFKVDREGKDPVILDFRPFAPFAQYLFVADVLDDFYRNTNWEEVHKSTLTEEEGMLASPLEWADAMWNNYEGKYTEGELGSQFAQAFLSISRAAGTTLTLTDLMTQNGWPSLEDAARATVGTIGQFFSRFTVPGQMTEVIPGYTALFPEEAKVRTPPKATSENWERPLAQPFANVPGAKQLIPDTISQTTGRPIAAEYPFLRGFLGIGTTPRDFVTEEVRRVGVPGQSVFIRETGDVEYDRMVAESYSRILKEELPAVLEDEEYRSLGTPARQRDYLQRYIFRDLKAAAIAEVRESLGEERYQDVTVTGEEARRRRRQLAYAEEQMGELNLPAAEPDDAEVGAPPPPGPGSTIGSPPPPPGF